MTDLLDSMNNKGPKVESTETVPTQTAAATTVETTKTTVETTPSKVEPESGSDWSLDSAMKEIKKLREENKARREKHAEELQQLKSSLDSKKTEQSKEVEELLAAKRELERLKEEQADKKRSLEEKLSVREQRLQEYELMMKQKESEAQAQFSRLQAELEDLRLEREARLTVQKAELERELTHIPETHKEFAQLMIKGAESPDVALLTLREAKLRGLFEEKKVNVVHTTPNAQTGARSTQDEIDRQRRDALKARGSVGLIQEGLKEAMRGSNTAAKFK